mgnify:CR=1
MDADRSLTNTPRIVRVSQSCQDVICIGDVRQRGTNRWLGRGRPVRFGSALTNIQPLARLTDDNFKLKT